MKFWAIAYAWQEEIYYDLSEEDDTHDLKETCFLPTREMAVEYISENLGADYDPVEITLERLEKNGTWSYARGSVKKWDEGY